MDVCNTCKKMFLIADLCKNRNYKNGYTKRCHQCQREMMRKNKGKNTINYKKQSLVRSAKSVPCTDCHEVYPYYVMDLDHLPEFKKNFGLGKYFQHTLQEVADELLKCEAVCANCHRQRTHSRGY